MSTGLGVMIQMLGGSRGVPADSYIGKVIKSLTLDGDINLHFEDGTGLRIYDDGQSCCENRYITTDDDLTKVVGETFQGIQQLQGEDRSLDHEVSFVNIITPSSTVTFETHVEHNGYYGGFYLKVTEL